jgi:integrase
VTTFNSSRRTCGEKPAKPHAAYPLTAHRNGQWCKKIKGQLWYFGTWDDPDGALQQYLDEKDDILAGRDPRRNKDGLPLRDLCNHFLTDRQQAMRDGDNIRSEHFQNLHADCARLLKILGSRTTVESLRPDDFAMFRSKLAEGVAANTLERRIARVRSVFQYGIGAELVDSVRWGNKFKKPSRRQLERDRNLRREKHGEYAFVPEQIRAILDNARPQIKAMVLLGVQAGFQNADCVELSINAVHFDHNQIRMVRRKTGSWRVVPLWQETKEVLHEVISKRPVPHDEQNGYLVFVTKYGNKWNRDDVGKELKKLLDDLGIYRPGLCFSSLRKTFRTVADAAGDQPAVFAITGHSMGDISDKYRERISDERLRAVVDHVHSWLFPPGVDSDREGDDQEPSFSTFAAANE